MMPDRKRRAPRAILLVALFVAIGSMGAQPRPLDAVAARHWAALLAVHDARSTDTVAVDSALGSTVPQLRAAAARVVGLNRIVARYPALRTLMLTDRDTAVRSDAAFAVGLATDPLSCDALRQSLPSAGAGAAAAWALGELGSRCGDFGALLAAATSAPARSTLLRVAGKWTPFPDSLVVAAVRTARSHDERWSALYALARARRSAGVAVAFTAVRDTAATIRELGARLLTATTVAPADSSRAIVALVRLLADRAPHTRIAAVRSLASFKSVALEPLQRAWPLERDVNVRVTMAQVIAPVASESAPLWSDWWNSDTTHMVRRSLITSAWQAGAIAALQRAASDSLATHPDFRIRIAMIDGAAARGADASARDILPRRSDSDPRVRAAAVSAIAATSPATRESLGWTSIRDSALRDPDVGVRQSALQSLASDGSAAVPMAIDGYLRAMADTGSDARESALGVIARAWRRDSSAFGADVIERLRALPPSTDPLLRNRVTGITPLAHWAAVSAGPDVATDYERVVREIIAPAMAGRAKVLDLFTDRGLIRIALDGVRAPMTVYHLSALAGRDYFRGQRFHRVVPAFVVQGGDPRGDGSGGPGVAIRDELNRLRYLRGAVGMALSGPDTGGSQFFLTLAPQPHLDGHYTVFGRVIRGAAVMDAIAQGDALRTISTLPQ